MGQCLKRRVNIGADLHRHTQKYTHVFRTMFEEACEYWRQPAQAHTQKYTHVFRTMFEEACEYWRQLAQAHTEIHTHVHRTMACFDKACACWHQLAQAHTEIHTCSGQCLKKRVSIGANLHRHTHMCIGRFV